MDQDIALDLNHPCSLFTAQIGDCEHTVPKMLTNSSLESLMIAFVESLK